MFRYWWLMRKAKREQDRFREGSTWALKAHYLHAKTLGELEDAAQPGVDSFAKGVLFTVENLRREKAELVRRSREKNNVQ